MATKNNKVKILVIGPIRKNTQLDFLDEMLKPENEVRVRIVVVFPPGHKCFTEPSGKDVYNFRGRKPGAGVGEMIVGIEINADPGRYEDVPLAKVMLMAKELGEGIRTIEKDARAIGYQEGVAAEKKRVLDALE